MAQSRPWESEGCAGGSAACAGDGASSLSEGGPETDDPTISAEDARRRPEAFGADVMKTRQSLLSAIKDPENSKSWTEFFDIYGPFIMRVGMRNGMDAHRAEDLVIEVLRDMNERIRNFSPEEGGFRKWLKTVALRRAVDIYRKDKRFPLPILNTPEDCGAAEGGQDADRIADTVNGLEAEWDAEEAKAILKLANRITKGRVSPRQWQIFECRQLRKWDVDRVCGTLGVNENQVYIAVTRIGPVFQEACVAAEALLDRGPLAPLDRQALDESLPLPSCAGAGRDPEKKTAGRGPVPPGG